MESRGRGRLRLPPARARLAFYSLVLVLLVTGLAITSVSGEALGLSWSGSSAYSTIGIELQSCVPVLDFSSVYCIGGFDGNTYTNNVQYAAFSYSGGVGSWTAAVGYPFSASGASCVTLGGYIYCIGGYDGSTRTTDVYYAQPSLSSPLSWTKAPVYPLDVELQSCVASGQYVYCVGGYTHYIEVNYYTFTPYTNETYFAAQTSATGLSSWTRSTPYPLTVEGQSCVTYSGYIYCVGGYDGNTGKFNNLYPVTDNVYFAQLSSNGIGKWTNTTAYPVAVYGESCAVQYDYVYCVGGNVQSGYSANVYYASLSYLGVGPWVRTTAYPTAVTQESCTTFYTSIDCFGGFNGNKVTAATYTNGIASLTPTTVTATSTTTSTSTSYLTDTTTATSVTTVNMTSTVTSTTLVKTVSSVTSTKTITEIGNSTVVSTSGGAPGSTQSPGQSVAQSQSRLLSSMFQIVPLALGAAVGVVIGVVVARLVWKRKKPVTREVLS